MKKKKGESKLQNVDWEMSFISVKSVLSTVAVKTGNKILKLWNASSAEYESWS